MIKKFAVAAALIAFLPGAAFALETPANAEQCHKLLDDITAGADPAKLPDDTLNKLDELLSRAENECEKGQFADVVKTAQAIQSMLPQAQKN